MQVIRCFEQSTLQDQYALKVTAIHTSFGVPPVMTTLYPGLQLIVPGDYMMLLTGAKYRYVLPHAKAGDVIAIGETPLAIMQGTSSSGSVLFLFFKKTILGIISTCCCCCFSPWMLFD